MMRSHYLGLAMLALSVPAAGQIATVDTKVRAEKKLRQCLLYNAIRADNRTTPTAQLIQQAASACRSRLVEWRFVLKERSLASGDGVVAYTNVAMTEVGYFKDFEEVLAPFLRAGRYGNN